MAMTVSQHFWKIQVLAIRALEGENVKAEVKTLVAKALDEFDTLATREPAINRAAFKRKLKFMASITHPNQPAQKEAFECAVSLIPEESRNLLRSTGPVRMAADAHLK
jgi:hypothetical protein